MINSHTIKKNSFAVLFCLLGFAASAQNCDSLLQAYNRLPENKNSSVNDTFAAYLLYNIVEKCEDESIVARYSQQLKEITQKRLAGLGSDHPLRNTYRKYFAGAMDQLGMEYREKGDVIKALDYMHQSLKIYEQLHVQEQLVSLYNNIATVYHDVGDEASAIKFFEKSYAIVFNDHSEKSRSKRFQVIANLAYVCYKDHRNDKALDYYHICLGQCKPGEDDYYIAECLNGRGLIYADQGRVDEALASQKKSLEIREKLNDRKGITTTLNNIGHDYLLLKRYKEALDYSSRSLQMSRELGSFERLRQAAFDLKSIYEHLGNYKEALKMQELYIQMRDSTNNEKSRKATLTKQLQYEYDKKEIIFKEEQARLKKLYEQKQKFYFILAMVLLLLILIVFLVFYFRYKFKKEKESKNLYIDLKDRLNQEIKAKEHIANSLLHIQEHEREKLAAELHDGVNQLLFAAKIQLQASKSVNENMYLEAVNMVDTAINEIKSIAANEGSFLLKNKLLKDALTDLILQMKGNRACDISFLNYGFDETRLDQDQKINVLRIIQELLNNAMKHANAPQVFISIKTTACSVVFAVTDNGQGMCSGKKGNGNGLKNISNKVALMNGFQRTFSLAGKGTRFFIMIPLS